MAEKGSFEAGFEDFSGVFQKLYIEKGNYARNHWNCLRMCVFEVNTLYLFIA